MLATMNRFEKRRELNAKLDVVLHARFVYLTGLFMVPLTAIGSIVPSLALAWGGLGQLFWSAFFGYQTFVWAVFASRARPVSRMNPLRVPTGINSFARGEFLLLFGLPALFFCGYLIVCV